MVIRISSASFWKDPGGQSGIGRFAVSACLAVNITFWAFLDRSLAKCAPLILAL